MEQVVASKIRVFWTNFGYASQEEFDSVEAAVVYARSKCFEASFWSVDEFQGSWSPIGGFRPVRHESGLRVTTITKNDPASNNVKGNLKCL